MAVQLQKHKMFIGGQWVESSSAETFSVRDPSSNEVFAEVPRATLEDARKVVDAARDALSNPAWRDIEATKRGRLLFQFSSLIRESFNELARLETLNVGKPLRESKGDVAWATRALDYFAGLADKIEGQTIPTPPPRLNYTLREPLGVTVHIVPWNYPLALAARSIAPALAAGNAVIVKPAELTPLTALKLAEFAKKAGLPDGVFNVLTGSGTVVGSALVSNPDVDGVTFTGSVETGKEVMRGAAEGVTPVTLELGGKNPNIVFPDADMPKAIQTARDAIFTNAGQMCWAGSRLFLHERIYESFLSELKKITENIQLGSGLDEKTGMGPLVSRAQQDRVLTFMKSGLGEGAQLVTGGAVPSDPGLSKGNFVQPTIFRDVKNDMQISCEEIFGPVLTVFKFSGADEVVQLANETQFGLYAGVWTNNLKLAHQLASRLQAGVVSINEYLVTFPQTPFGGFKDSGIGFENGIQSLNNHTRVKNVSVNLA